jgi:hypothetical protein
MSIFDKARGLFSGSSNLPPTSILYVEAEEPVFTNRFLLRFLDNPKTGRAAIERALTKKHVHIFGVQDHEDLAIIIPQSEESVVLCRNHLKTSATEVECPPGCSLEKTFLILLDISGVADGAVKGRA